MNKLCYSTLHQFSKTHVLAISTRKSRKSWPVRVFQGQGVVALGEPQRSWVTELVGCLVLLYLVKLTLSGKEIINPSP